MSVSIPGTDTAVTVCCRLRVHCRYRAAVGRKVEKGERFRMMFEDGKYYNGVIVGCMDAVLRLDDNASAGSVSGGATATQRHIPEVGVPWEALLVSD